MSDASPLKITFDDVVKYLSDPKIIGNFPREVLKERLSAIGVEEIIEAGAIARKGFPFKYHNPFDEAILVLHYFLSKSQLTPGSHIQINSTHVPTKEEENTLSSWKSPKAGLYLDLHALIENHNHSRGKKGQIKRVFVFRDHAQLAFLESTGIGVILEQESIGIQTAFLLLSEQHERVTEVTWAGVQLVQLLHDEVEKCEWFIGIDTSHTWQKPYDNSAICRWQKGRVSGKTKLAEEVQEESVPINLKKYFDLFRFENREPELKTGDRSYRFESDPERFRRLLEANYREAFPRGEVSKEEFDQHLNFRAIPENLQQLCLALEHIKQSSEIKAIDASSVKSTLRVHDADPNYRHWIRTTVQRALKNKETVSLERIYILSSSRDEYEVFKQEIDLYRDLMTNRISRLDGAQHTTADALPRKVDGPPVNIRLYALTMQAVEDICRETDKKARAALRELVKADFARKDGLKLSSIMSELDFLYSEKLVFNYKDYKGEPGRAFYDADLFLPGESGLENNIVTYLRGDEFARRRSKYSRLFEILRKRSIQVLPNDAGDFQTLEDFEDALAAKGVEQISLSETQSEVISKESPNVRRPKIFVSYASEDKARVHLICDKFRGADYQYWEYQDGILCGEAEIRKQELMLEDSDFFLPCLSANYNRKPGEIQAERKQALEKARRLREDDIFILPILLDDTEVPHDLKDYRAIELFQGTELQELGWEKLLKALAEGWKRRNS